MNSNRNMRCVFLHWVKIHEDDTINVTCSVFYSFIFLVLYFNEISVSLNYNYEKKPPENRIYEMYISLNLNTDVDSCPFITS